MSRRMRRYEGIIGLTPGNTRRVPSVERREGARAAGALITSCTVSVASADETLSLATDVSYKLDVMAPMITITAPTV
jgi:hypothetical protein